MLESKFQTNECNLTNDPSYIPVALCRTWRKGVFISKLLTKQEKNTPTHLF